MDEKLYQAILDRKAHRRYQKTPLQKNQLKKINELTKNLVSINPNSKVEFKLMDTLNEIDLVSSMGGYGRILDAPHFAIPHISECSNDIIELGYQTQQWVNLITKENIDSCYIGAIHRGTNSIHEKFKVPENKQIAATIIFGTQKNIKNPISKKEKQSPRKPLNDIFYRVDEDLKKCLDDPNWNKILIAARQAPSAGNAQPWKFILLENELTIYADPQAYIPLLRNVGKTYALHDVGILMANITQACQSIDWKAQWEIFSTANEQSLSFGKWTSISKAIIKPV